jgi:LmbE family N-acetylglucosaminyl deacetylase
MIRRAVKRRLNDRLDRRASPIDAVDLDRPTVVLAPHPDDETLGCGGLVAIKRSRGVPVTVVFMTDGAGSHAQLMPTEELAARRRAEATTATGIIGIEPENVRFLSFPDGGLAESFDPAVGCVREILRQSSATQLLLPHPDEPPSDHSVTYRIAVEAVRQNGVTLDAFLYPVWLWDQWPWTNPLAPPRARHSLRAVLRRAVRGRGGLALCAELRHKVDIGAVVDRKRGALAAHATQTSRLDGRSDWLTLGDVAHGEWLDQQMSGTEYFAKTVLAGEPGSPRSADQSR